jgi:hypothetical protein
MPDLTPLETIPVNAFSSGTITVGAEMYRGILLDRLDIAGPRGGISTAWRVSGWSRPDGWDWFHSRRKAVAINRAESPPGERT